MVESNDAANQARPLALNVANNEALYRAYMPFLKTGGIFVPTTETIAMGAEVLVLLTVVDQAMRIPIGGTVAWITPRGASNKRQAGVGVQFKDGSDSPKAKLEALLGGALTADRPTQTM